MTLNKTWTECLRMWKWVSDGRRIRHTSVEELKGEWLKNNDYDRTKLAWDCFFCEYAHQRTNKHWAREEQHNCVDCPARQVDDSFHCCDVPWYNYAIHPKAFYRKLVELNKKRLNR